MSWITCTPTFPQFIYLGNNSNVREKFYEPASDNETKELSFIQDYAGPASAEKTEVSWQLQINELQE